MVELILNIITSDKIVGFKERKSLKHPCQQIQEREAQQVKATLGYKYCVQNSVTLVV